MAANKSEMDLWNPMEQHFKSSNPYPGVDCAAHEVDLTKLDLGKLLEKVDKSHLRMQSPYLVINNTPPKMTKESLKNLCAQYGRVLNVRDSKKNKNYFVDFETVADMMATFKQLTQNSNKMNVYIGVKDYKKSESPLTNSCTWKEPEQVDMPNLERRSVYVSENKPLRPVFEEHCSNEGASHLNGTDTERWLMFKDDAHVLENVFELKLQKYLVNKTFTYRKGRYYRSAPQMKCCSNPTVYNQSKNHFSNMGTFEGVSDCVECGNICSSKCSKCDTYFCCMQCQREGWTKHNVPCCSKPQPLKFSEKGQKKIEKRKENENGACFFCVNMPHRKSEVTITSIHKTNIVFVRSINKENQDVYLNLVSQIHLDSKNLESISQPPQLGEIVVSKFGEHYNRAVVLDASEVNAIKIIYMDFGNIDVKALSDLYAAPPHFASIPCHITPIILKGVSDFYMTEEIRQFLYCFVTDTNFRIVYQQNDYNKDKCIYQAQLIDVESGHELNELLEPLCKPSKPRKSDIFTRDYLCVVSNAFPAGANVELVIMNNTELMIGTISCTTEQFALEIQKFQKYIAQYCDTIKDTGSKEYTPRVEELCLAKYSGDSQWYRARCVEIVGDGWPTLHFIDYGNMEMVSIRNISSYPNHFTFPILTKDCEIIGLPEELDDSVVAKLEELLPIGKKILCECVEEDDTYFYKISLPDILTQVLKEDHDSTANTQIQHQCDESSENNIPECSEKLTEVNLQDIKSTEDKLGTILNENSDAQEKIDEINLSNTESNQPENETVSNLTSPGNLVNTITDYIKVLTRKRTAVRTKETHSQN